MSRPQRTARSRKLLLVAVGVAAVAVLSTAMGHWRLIRYWYVLREEFALTTFSNAGGFPEFRHRNTGIAMVLLPGGVFAMGRSLGDTVTRKDEIPAHEVVLDPFLIGKYEVSQAEWRRIMDENLSTFVGDDLPVETVSWGACAEFCSTVNLRLPTEAQWEYACRAGAEGMYSTGDRLRQSEARFGVSRAEDQGTVSVRSMTPNAFGLHHMHGNAPEWCEDVYDREFYRSETARERNPVCTSQSTSRVIRGGGWESPPADCRSAARSSGHHGRDFLVVGFRVAYRFE